MRILEGMTLRKICRENIITGDSLSRIDFSKVISLNDTAAYLWEELKDRDFTADDMTDLLTARYDVSAETAHSDVIKLLDSWRAAGLIAE